MTTPTALETATLAVHRTLAEMKVLVARLAQELVEMGLATSAATSGDPMDAGPTAGSPCQGDPPTVDYTPNDGPASGTYRGSPVQYDGPSGWATGLGGNEGETD